MGFSLEVLTGAVSPAITQAWIAGLVRHGLKVEAHPRFSFERWRGGWAPFQCSIERPGYPTAPISAGFELDIGPNAEAEVLAARAPEYLQRFVSEASRVFHFSTAAGRTVADLRLQVFGAAVLAELADGVVYDPQRDEFFAGPAAIQNAFREAESFEAAAEPAAWRFEAGTWGGTG